MREINRQNLCKWLCNLFHFLSHSSLSCKPSLPCKPLYSDFFSLIEKCTLSYNDSLFYKPFRPAAWYKVLPVTCASFLNVCHFSVRCLTGTCTWMLLVDIWSILLFSNQQFLIEPNGTKGISVQNLFQFCIRHRTEDRESLKLKDFRRTSLLFRMRAVKYEMIFLYFELIKSFIAVFIFSVRDLCIEVFLSFRIYDLFIISETF